MSSYRVRVHPEAWAEIRALPGHMRQRVRRAVRDLAVNPRPHQSQTMQPPTNVLGAAEELRRLRLDRWRVVYVVDDEWTEVVVLAVRRRPPYRYEDLVGLLAGR